MLNAVTKLCEGDFSGLVKEYEVWQLDQFAGAFKIATFENKSVALNFLNNAENETIKGGDKFTSFEIKEIKYECS